MEKSVRFPAEWEPQAAILIAWPNADTDWADRLAEVEETYIALVAAIARFYRTKQSPVSAEETLEIYAFMEDADESKRRGGTPVSLRDVLDKAYATAAARLEQLGVK